MCSCQALGAASFYAAVAAFFGLAYTVLHAMGGAVSPVGLAFFIVGLVAAVACMVARRSLQVASARLGYYPTSDGGVVLRERFRRHATVTAGEPVIDGVVLDHVELPDPVRRITRGGVS